MKRFLKSLLLALVVVFAPVLLIVRYMESAHRFDSLGWPYTLYVTLGVAVPVALGYAGIRTVILMRDA